MNSSEMISQACGCREPRAGIRAGQERLAAAANLIIPDGMMYCNAVRRFPLLRSNSFLSEEVFDALRSSQELATGGLHSDRAVGGDRDYRDPHRVVASGGPGR